MTRSYAGNPVWALAKALGPHPQDPELRVERATAVLDRLPTGWRLVGPVDYSGHRTAYEHDCFLMQCHTLGREIVQLREQLAETVGGTGVSEPRTDVGKALLVVDPPECFGERHEPCTCRHILHCARCGGDL